MPNDNKYDMLDDTARQEELHLKKIRQGIIEDTSNEEYLKEKKQKEEAPVTLSEKVSNFWFHYKWATIGTLVAAIIVISFTIQALNTVKYDTTVLLCTHAFYSEDTILEVSDKLADYVSDINENGKIDVGVFQANYRPSGEEENFTGYQNSLMSRIMVEIASGENCIFIVDDEMLTSLCEKGVFADLRDVLSIASDREVYGIDISNSDILSDSEFKDAKLSYKIAIRVYKEGTDKETYNAQVEAVKKIYQSCIKK